MDPAYRDAEDELLKICLNRLVVGVTSNSMRGMDAMLRVTCISQGMGFQSTLAETALREYKTVEASIAAIVSGKGS